MIRLKMAGDIACTSDIEVIEGVPRLRNYFRRSPFPRRMGAKKLQSMTSEDSYYMLGWEKILG